MNNARLMNVVVRAQQPQSKAHQAERDIHEWASLQVGHHRLVSALEAVEADKARGGVPAMARPLW